MRKLFATLAVCLVLFGIFSPLSFSVGRGIKNTTIIPSKALAIGPTTFPSDSPPPAAPGNTTTTTTTVSDGNTTVTTDTAANTECGLLDLFCHIFRIWLTFTMFVPQNIVAGVGIMADWSIHYSISSSTFRSMDNTSDLVYAGWKIVRDFANIGFIFALFVAAFSLIVGKNFLGFEPKKTVVRVVIMALLINFSLFFCRVIIQTGDLLGNFIYNQISADDAGNTFNSVRSTVSTVESGPTGVLKAIGAKGVTLTILANINPQKLLQASGADYNISTLEGIGLNIKGWAYYVQMGFLSIVSFFLSILFVLLFGSIAILFSSRVFGLWILIIMAPLAFVSYAIPMIDEDNKYFGFKNWLNELVKLTFAAPVFLFFVYLVVFFLSSETVGLQGLNPNWGGFWATFALIFAKITAVIFILRKGKTIAFEMSGRAGDIAQKIVDKTTGALTTAALSAATGGTAAIARQTLGRAGAALANSGAVKGMMQGNSFAGRLAGGALSSAGNKLGAASFDIRNSKKGMELLGKFGDASGGPINLGDRFKNTGGFNTEGGVRDIGRNITGSVNSWIVNQDKKVAEKLAVADSEKVSRDLRTEEDKLAQAKEAFEAEKSKVDVEAQNTNVNLGQFITNLNNSLTQLRNTDPNVTTNVARKAQLEAIPEDQRTTAEKTELKNLASNTNVVKYQKTEKEVSALTDALNRIPPAQRGTMTVRLVKQQAENLNEIAKNSIQKEEMDKAKESRDEEKKKLDDTQKEYNNLKKTYDNLPQNSPERQRMEDDLESAETRLNEQRAKHKKKEREFKEKEATYQRDYGNQIKALEDSAKATADAYKEANKGRIRTKQNLVVDQQILVNNKQNEKDNITYENQLQFSRNLDTSDSRAKTQSADQIRRDYLQNKSKGKPKEEKKDDKK